jgi:uncharacterized protein (DUF2062 family)
VLAIVVFHERQTSDWIENEVESVVDTVFQPCHTGSIVPLAVLVPTVYPVVYGISQPQPAASV